jgi:uncharacterized protein YdhG (YjbR/CyaY superfamily)
LQKQILKLPKQSAPEIPTFTLNGNLVHFAAYKNHIGFYPTPSVIEAFKKSYRSTRVQKDRYNI